MLVRSLSPTEDRWEGALDPLKKMPLREDPCVQELLLDREAGSALGATRQVGIRDWSNGLQSL